MSDDSQCGVREDGGQDAAANGAAVERQPEAASLPAGGTPERTPPEHPHTNRYTILPSRHYSPSHDVALSLSRRLSKYRVHVLVCGLFFSTKPLQLGPFCVGIL